MKKLKRNTGHLCLLLSLLVLVGPGFGQTKPGGQTKLPSFDISIDAPSYYVYNNGTKVLSVTNGVSLGASIYFGTYSVPVRRYLSTDASIATTDYSIGTSSVTLTIEFLDPSDTDTLTTTVDLDDVAGLSLTDGDIYYVGAIANYDRAIAELAGSEAHYAVLYTNNIWCSADPIYIGTETQAPYILNSLPDSGAMNASIKDTIIIAFSEWMKTTGFTYAVSPNPGGLSTKWNTRRDTLKIAHNAFAYATAETVSITHAEDLCGNLLTGRSVITFTTTPNLAPVITMKTQPTSPQTIGRPYLVQAVIKDPAKGGKSITTDSLYYRVNGGAWSALGTVSVKGDTFSFYIPAIDSGLVEYYLQAWDNAGAASIEPSSGYHSFDVNTLPPIVAYSTPDSGVISVALNVPVMVVFSAPVDTTSFSFTLLPNPGGVSRTWNKGRDTLRIAHSLFTYATTETLSITHAVDLFGHLLTGRSVITFTTISNQGPVITMKTQPSSPQTIGRPYLVQAVIKDPAKGGKSITADSLYYLVDGGPLSGLGTTSVKGDTFSFKIPAIDSGLVEYYLQAWDNIYYSTIDPPSDYYFFTVNTLPPAITYSTPDSGAVNVALNAPVMIVFSEQMDTGSFTFTLLPDPGGVSCTWNTGRDTLRIAHNPFIFGAEETLSITHATDLFGHLLPGWNVFTFTTLSEPVGDLRWDGRFGTAAGLGMNSSVYVLYPTGNNVYAGGGFTTTGGVSANYIAKWDGTSWSGLGAGMNSTVLTIAVSNGNIYAGGFFTTAGGVSANYIAKWDGSSWSALGSGMNGVVRALAFIGSTLYAGGDFTTAGGVSAKNIAKWDGTSWSALGSGMNGSVYSLAVSDSNIYVGGPFTLAGGDSAKYIAKWAGASWSALGSGTNSGVRAIAISDSHIYVGGWFTTAGGKSSNYFGIYYDTPDVVYPIITFSTPDSGSSNVALNVPITIAFSKPMDTTSFAFDMTPNPGGVTGNWNTNGDTLSVTHNPFAYATPETVSITYAADLSGKQLSGRRVITFTTTSNQGPAISIKTQPSDPQTEPGPYLVQAVIADPAKKTGKSIAADTLYYSVNSGPWWALSPSGVVGDTFSFHIPAIDSGSIDYCIKAWDNTGLTTMEPEFGYYTFQVDTLKTGVSGRPEPQTFILQLNSASPNPVTGGRTAIRFSLPEQTEVKLEVYNVLGQKVNTLADGRLEKGWHTVDWNGRDGNGQKLSSGVYVYQLKALGKIMTKRMTLIR